MVPGQSRDESAALSVCRPWGWPAVVLEGWGHWRGCGRAQPSLGGGGPPF